MNPHYRLDQPALISVSGGRTSGFMLRKILDAFGGELPRDVIPVFCNTGREHEATLQFLKEIGERWCPIVWLEYRREDDKHGFAVVDYCTASRNGEPFAAAIQARSYLPNPVTRFCTAELKIRTGNRFAKWLGWESFTRAIGLRYDEPLRVAKMKGEGNEEAVMPLHAARRTLAHVRSFWAEQEFDLQLPGDDNAFGNCDLCFLKARAKVEKVLRADPSRGEWWAEQEALVGASFRNDRPTYRQMLTQLTVQGQMFDDAIEDDTLPCNCTD